MDEPVVFVACPYGLFPLDDYKSIFSEISANHNVEFVFADQQITNQYILEKIRQHLKECSFALFDITGWNPNVTLELGIAIGAERRYFILLNTKLEIRTEVPSDIRGIDRIQYGSLSELKAKIIELIKQERPAPRSIGFKIKK